MKYYVLKPFVKLIPQMSVAATAQEILELTKEEVDLLLKLNTRPLWEQEVTERLKPLLLEIDLANFNEDRIQALYDLGSEAHHQALHICANEAIVLRWGEDELSLPKGNYLLTHVLPMSIRGSHDKTYLEAIVPHGVRDAWVLGELRALAFSDILELGPGREARLFHQLRREFPQASYLGMGLEVPRSGPFKQQDLKDELPQIERPHVVIATEVIEHLPEASVLNLLQRLLEHRASVIILTTPNRDYNKFLQQKFRHPDHFFEWDELEVKAFIRRLENETGVTVSLKRIGKEIRGVCPTWGLIINHS